jgi:tRNA-splicing ligase RtcB
MGKKIKGKDLIALGFPQNNTVNIALGQISRYKRKYKKAKLLNELSEVIKNKDQYRNDPVWGKVIEAMEEPVVLERHELKTTRAPFEVFGENEISEDTKYQLYGALKLPVAVQGALMPDAHRGYGLPIGGVLATKNAVIPYGVGVDIGCRMAMSVFPLPASHFKGRSDQLKNILSEHTKFGMYQTHRVKHDHEIFARSEFNEIPLLKKLFKKAYHQLGTSGGGNHFVEFGVVNMLEDLTIDGKLKLPKGEYLALLSHSGSRGLGANIAKHYTYLAQKQCPLPKQVQHLAWLDLDKHDGMEYWLAMNLAGDYAKACHDNIHYRVAKALGTKITVTIENHHNFAWKEMVNGEECIVHRKGATPAGKDVLGIIPGSMTAPGYVVRGLGNERGLNSASHGAGRRFSRSQCKSKFTQSDVKHLLNMNGVELIGGNIDEAPQAYKDIRKVMANQQELVEVIGEFTPKIVRMDR